MKDRAYLREFRGERCPLAVSDPPLIGAALTEERRSLAPRRQRDCEKESVRVRFFPSTSKSEWFGLLSSV